MGMMSVWCALRYRLPLGAMGSCEWRRDARERERGAAVEVRAWVSAPCRDSKGGFTFLEYMIGRVHGNPAKSRRRRNFEDYAKSEFKNLTAGLHASSVRQLIESPASRTSQRAFASRPDCRPLGKSCVIECGRE